MKKLMLLSLLGVGLMAAPSAQAQPVVFGVGVGVGPVYGGAPPVCAYGYYPYYPYACAPYGYYGPDWFAGGVFIGAGPWFHGWHGRPGYWGRPGNYGRGYAGPAYNGRAGYRGGPVARGPVGGGRGPVGGATRGGLARGGAAGGFHAGGGFHGGGHR
jgi:hypothetical protein